MGYYMAGDYYAAGGIFGSIGRAIGGVAKTVGGLLPGPIGGIVSTVGGVLAPSKRNAAAAPPSIIPIATSMPTIVPGGSVQRTPGITGVMQRLVPGGQTGYEFVGKKRKRINPANPKALRRAIRRQAGFVKLARRALKGTGYTIASRGTRRGRMSISESGPGSVVVRGR